jgi:putative membrane protein
MYGHQFMGNGFFMPGFFFWIITLGIIFFIFNSIFDRKNKAKDSNEEALIIAKKRFANGEINEEEYKKIKTVLE